MALFRNGLVKSLSISNRSLIACLRKDSLKAASFSQYQRFRKDQFAKLRCSAEAEVQQRQPFHSSQVVRGLELRTKPDVSYEELLKIIESNDSAVHLIDVREPKELESSGTIPTATNIPLSKVKKALLNEDTDVTLHFPNSIRREQNLIFYGLKNVKAVTALEIARKLGYKRLIADALNLSPAKFKTLYGFEKPDEDAELVFSCLIGKRSLVAREIAKSIGYTRARHYPGGWSEWSEKTNGGN